jgi:copper chaperone CopZ
LHCGQTETQKTDSVKTVTVKVSGITCGNDLKIISNNVQKKNGVVSCASIGKTAPTTTFEIKYNPAIIPIDSIYNVVENSPSCDFPDQKPYKVKKGK